MRALLALVLLAGVANAEQVAPLDLCEVTAASLAEENAKLRLELARLRLQLKYKLAEGDTVDQKTFEIKRAEKKK